MERGGSDDSSIARYIMPFPVQPISNLYAHTSEEGGGVLQRVNWERNLQSFMIQWPSSLLIQSTKHKPEYYRL